MLPHGIFLKNIISYVAKCCQFYLENKNCTQNVGSKVPLGKGIQNKKIKQCILYDEHQSFVVVAVLVLISYILPYKISTSKYELHSAVIF